MRANKRCVVAAVLSLLALNTSAQTPERVPLQFVSDNGVCQFYVERHIRSDKNGEALIGVYTTCNVGGARPNIGYNKDGSTKNLDADNWSYIDWFDVRCDRRQSRPVRNEVFDRQFWEGEKTETRSAPSVFIPYPDPRNDVWFGGGIAKACEIINAQRPSI
ncbi:hypothetical protein [Burkholderia gladioli]|uniref:hypothetical protein n=1 Tax=Burkholderia gladioli TaxID=28095 RepID=UPI0034DAC18B